ncbi:MAG: metallophosphoesterase [Steroidobacteraceae bacterium]
MNDATRPAASSNARLRGLSLLAVALLAGCAAPQPNNRKPGTAAFGFLAFGDSGYHYDYLDPDDVQQDVAAYLAHERAEWREDRRAPGEFAAAPPHTLSDGRVVAASGALPVASAMRAYCANRDCRFAAMLGDNIYPEGATAGVDGRDDATRFRAVFEAPYGRFGEIAPGFRIYAALGNHDWKTSRAGALAELHYLEASPPFYMDGFFYRVIPPGLQGQVELFVIDTELLLARVVVPETAVDWDGSEILLPERDGPAVGAEQQAGIEHDRVAWLERALATSTARWKIVVGHHPLWSTAGSKFAQARALRSLILPTLCRYADMYLAGHEHTLEMHLDDCTRALPGAHVPPLLQVVSGAAAKQRPSNGAFAARQQAANPELRSLFSRGMVWGFAHVSIDGDRATARLLSTPDDAGGQPVEEFRYNVARRSQAGTR